MPSEIMDQRGASSLLRPLSFFSEEIRFPAERQVGFWKPGSMPDHGTEGRSLMSGNKMDASSPLDKNRQMGEHVVDCVELCQPYIVKDQNAKHSLERHMVGVERSSNLSMSSWKVMEQDLGTRSNLYVQPAALFVEGNKVGLSGPPYENSLFSSSLSEIFNKKLRLSSNDVLFSQSINAVTSHFDEDEPFESLEEIEAQTIGNLLPDDDDLLSGVIDDLEYFPQPNIGDDIEDFDLFSSGGGMELEVDDALSCYGGNKSSDFNGGIPNGQQGGPNSAFAGEHPYGEHPSRTLFVRNINSNVEDSELRILFEQYGDIRTLYTACKHRGFVMISYYDIRAARNAMRALQNKPLRRRKLDIHFSIPKDNPSEKDVNQGTLVVFNLDSSVSNDELRQIFGRYGEIKEIRETPHKRHHKFIEFYDVRAAEAALRALNKSDIAGKRIKLEPSRPGGARRLMQQFSPELEQEEDGGCRQQGSPPNNSPSGCFGPVPPGTSTSSCLDSVAIQGLHSATRAPISPLIETAFHGISSSVPHSLSSPIRVASVSNHSSHSGIGEPSHSLGHMKFGFQGMPTFHPHSLPEYHDGVANAVAYNSPGTMSAISANITSRPAEGVDNRHIHRVTSNGLNNGHSFELNESVFGTSGNGSCPLHGHQYVWNNSNSYHPHPPNSIMWQNSPSFVNGVHAHSPHQMHGFPRPPSHILNTVLPLHPHPHHHHVGSAPAVNPSVWDRRHAYAGHAAEASAFHPGSLGSMGFSGGSTLHQLELAQHNIFPHVGANSIDPPISSPNVGLPSPQQRCHMFPSRNPMIPMPNSIDAPNEQRVRSRRNEANSNQADNKKQFELDIDRILRGEDSRTTLMIKNIPNKYTSKMLLAAIDEHHRGSYDFIYLPIDFKNKCNVGYAFINMIDPMRIVPFFQAFNGKKWEKFNSEKVASLAYARIQGKAALIAHFQNSSLMNEDKRCRPILFHSEGPNAGDQEPFPIGVNIRSRPGKTRTQTNEENHQGSPSSGEEYANGTGSSPGSVKDSG
ncbi:protein MEI2-like 4 isoform X2 [Magnolia sinica]|uniref:protein MEI2-like 4 isoform X2 n=1 Tax=Magnolia sinica TaxID=86752 RepID=UPI00265B3BFC|nr:protein MEI2-like 4 isoform X2 [Magnolia sinica]